MALPRWTLRFLSGLFITALGYATRNHKGKVKGIQINGSSAIILVPNDSGALSLHIDSEYNIAISRCTTNLRFSTYFLGYIISISTIQMKIS